MRAISTPMSCRARFSPPRLTGEAFKAGASAADAPFGAVSSTRPRCPKGVNAVKSPELLAHRHRDEQQGFTLIELMVVVLIIAILIAIAIPTFLGARKRAQDRATQSDLRNALTNEQVAYTDNQAYDPVAANMKVLDPSLDWGGKITIVVGDASVGTNDMVCVSEASKSGTTFSLAHIALGPATGYYYGKVACPAATEANFSSLGA